MILRLIFAILILTCSIEAGLTNKGIGPTALNPKLVLNQQGQALIAWNTGGGVVGGVIQYAVYHQENKAFEAPINIPGITENTLLVSLSMNNKGDALAIWNTVAGHIQYSIYDKATYRFSPAQTLLGTSPYSQDPSIVLNDEGDALATWYDAQMNIQYAIYHKISKKFEAAKTLLNAKTSLAPQLAMNDKGEALITWYDTLGESVNYCFYDKISGFLPSQKILNTRSAANLSLALNHAGDSILAWNTGADTTFSGMIQYVIYDKKTKLFGPIKTLPSTKQQSQNAFPQVSLNQKGEAFLVWCKLTADGKEPIGSAIYDQISQQFISSKSIPGATVYSTAPEIALNDKGKAIATWFTTMNGTIEYAIFDENLHSFSSAQKILGVGSNSEYPVVSLNNEGMGLIVWGALGSIQYSQIGTSFKNFGVAKTLPKSQ
jgi:hypothetical protein